MDVLSDPFSKGREDPPESGVWFGRVPNENIEISYVINADTMTICVAIIAQPD
jgi:hypothetical protein